MRAFVRMRELLNSNKELARRFAQLEARIDKKLAAHDDAITTILSAIRQLIVTVHFGRIHPAQVNVATCMLEA
jgi:uncharacterized protein YqcC (DUF446 family)